jgi:hypothetical protein
MLETGAAAAEAALAQCAAPRALAEAVFRAMTAVKNPEGRPPIDADIMARAAEDFRCGESVRVVTGRYGICRTTAYDLKRRIKRGEFPPTPKQQEKQCTF